MRPALLSLTLLLVACFSLATWLVPWHQEFSRDREQSSGVIALFMGDSRRLFANYFFTRADVYFHSGYYASAFDLAAKTNSAPASATAQDHSRCQHAHGKCEHTHSGCKHDHGRPAREDWIARFSRNFYPSEHTHLGKNGDEREILPWLRLSAELDPQRVETYTVAAFWLRDRLGRAAEADQFLREGLHANPDSHAILFELGRTYAERDRDTDRARNDWELALKQWLKNEAPKPAPDLFGYSQIVAQLALAEERDANFEKSIAYLRLLKKASPYQIGRAHV